VRPIRLLLAVSATAVVVAACGDDSTSGSGTPARADGSSAASSPSASAAGGGVADKSADEILTAAKAAFQKAESVRLKGGGTADGETFQIDMAYGPDKALGSVSSSGQKIELRRIGTTVYLKADKAFWTQSAGAAAAELLGDKYLKAPVTDQRVASLASFTDKDKFAGELFDKDSTDGPLSKGEQKDVNGSPAIALVDKSADGGTLWIATSGDPLPLRLTPEGTKATGSTPAESGSLDFTDYGKSFEVPVPPAAETIDVTKLGNN
jgi:hypothetical protein